MQLKMPACPSVARVVCRSARRLGLRHLPRTSRALSSSAMPTMTVFDRVTKKRQRDRAALAANWQDYSYLRSEVAQRLVDRLEDITKEFPLALELGAYGPEILRGLTAVEGLSQKGGAGGVERLIRCGMSEAGLSMGFEAAKEGPGKVAVHNVVADEEHLPAAPNTFDLIISNLALHWVNDVPSALQQACEVLKPDGVFLASMLGGNTLRELRMAMQLAEQEVEGGISPHVSPTAHVADCGALLQAAGFNLPTIDVDTVTVHYPDMFVLMKHLQSMGESNAIISRRAHVSRRTFQAAAAKYKEMFGEPDGSISATFQVIYMIGWKPHESQQRPLRRGSATKSFKTLSKDDQPEKQA